MDFVDWCGFVLNTCIEVSRTSSTARSIGVDEFQLAQALSVGIPGFSSSPEYWDSTYHQGLYQALQNLKDAGALETNERSSSHWRVTKVGREYALDMTPLWWSICQERLEQEHQEMLCAVNQLSMQGAADHAWLADVSREAITSELGWQQNNDQIWPIAQELKEWRLIAGHFFIDGNMALQATYRGLVWETRRGFTLESKFIDSLVAEWETTSVDFKREVHTDTASEKAELIKDIIGLANTKASGRRWLIIGFDDKTHDYYGPPDPKLSQNHFEHLTKQYTTPMVEIRYEVVDYRKGKVGKLEIVRDPKKLPYHVAKSLGDKALGDKKRIEQDQIFVRHGSQTEEPTPAELQALQEEGNQARSTSP